MTAPSCLTCKFAVWKRTAAGRLHPSGGGRCSWVMPDIILPSAFYYIGGGPGRPGGGYIERFKPHLSCPIYDEVTP